MSINKFSTTEVRNITSVPVQVTPIREITIDIEAKDLRSAAEGMDYVIVRIRGLSFSNGRPTSRTLRIPASLLLETRSNDWN